MMKSLTNKISNVTASDKYGQSVHFISFYCSILARLAYMNDTTFLGTTIASFAKKYLESSAKILEQMTYSNKLIWKLPKKMMQIFHKTN